MKTRALIAATLIGSWAMLAGCAGTSATSPTAQSDFRLAQGERLKLQLNAPTMTKEGEAILRQRLVMQLANSALLASAADASSKTIEVTVTNYYMRHGAARALVGIMAGSDNVQSTIQIMDAGTRKVLSEFRVESKNPTAWGTSRGLLEEHADRIVETLTGVKLMGVRQ